MKIAVVNTQVPFVRGGAEALAQWLVEQLRQRGHETEHVRLPFWVAPPQTVLENALAARFMRITGVDRVIGLSSSRLLLHPTRRQSPLGAPPAPPGLRALGHEFQQELPDTIEGRYVRRVIVDADNRLLGVRRGACTAISGVDRAAYADFSTGSSPPFLYPPVGDEGSYDSAGSPRAVRVLPEPGGPDQAPGPRGRGHAIRVLRCPIGNRRPRGYGAGGPAGCGLGRGGARGAAGGWMPEQRKLELSLAA